MNKNAVQGRFCASKGFTLIELLVVVLIIGILAAVAVPQYQKAVYKARTTEAMSILKALKNAEEVYFLANGEYTSDISKLDVDVPAELINNEGEETQSEHYVYSCTVNYCAARNGNTSMPFFDIFFTHTLHIEIRNKFFCHLGSRGYKNNIAKSICQSMGTVDTSINKTWWVGNYFVINN